MGKHTEMLDKLDHLDSKFDTLNPLLGKVASTLESIDDVLKSLDSYLVRQSNGTGPNW